MVWGLTCRMVQGSEKGFMVSLYSMYPPTLLGNLKPHVGFRVWGERLAYILDT